MRAGKIDRDGLPTGYNGVDYRSVLEARWAAFFHMMGVLVEYEPKTFVLGDGRPYTPDFYLPKMNLWAEVKPDATEIVDAESAKALRLKSDMPDINICLFVGIPNYGAKIFRIEVGGHLARLKMVKSDYIDRVIDNVTMRQIGAPCVAPKLPGSRGGEPASQHAEMLSRYGRGAA